jgi:hypothetical protein
VGAGKVVRFDAGGGGSDNSRMLYLPRLPQFWNTTLERTGYLFIRQVSEKGGLVYE